MSVQTEIDRISGNVAATYKAAEELGANLPAEQNSDNLPGTIRAIPTAEIVQETGSSETAIMSQAAVTRELNKQSEEIADKVGYSEVDSIVDEAVENEKGNIVDLIIDELHGLPVFGVVDEDNNVTVTTLLPNGTYSLKYENEDGTIEEIGTITVTDGGVAYVNLLPTALTPNDITSVFDGVGYKNGYYASAASPYYNTDSAFFCTGLMPISANATFYIQGCTINTSLSHTRFGLMGENGGLINTAVIGSWNGTFTVTELGDQYYSITIDTSNSTLGGAVPYYFYFSASGTGENVIVSHTPIE